MTRGRPRKSLCQQAGCPGIFRCRACRNLRMQSYRAAHPSTLRSIISTAAIEKPMDKVIKDKDGIVRAHCHCGWLSSDSTTFRDAMEKLLAHECDTTDATPA